MNIEDLVPEVLNTLVGGRVWESATPENLPRDDITKVVLPFIVWTVMGGQDSEYVEQTPAPTHSNARIQVHAVTPLGTSPSTLMKAVRDALLASTYTVGVYGSPVGTYDAARKLKGRFQQFSVWFQH